MLHELVLNQLMPDLSAGQRALLVSGSPKRVSPAVVRSLAHYADLVVAVDSGAELLVAADMVPDLLLGDFDSIDKAVLDGFMAAGVAVEIHDVYKDATDTELALRSTALRGYTSIFATNVLGGRLDHELAALGCLAEKAKSVERMVIVGEDELCIILDAGSSDRCLNFDFGTEAPSYISLVPWAGNAEVSIHGVEWELDRFTLSPASSRGISNEPRKAAVDITVHKGTVLVMLQV